MSEAAGDKTEAATPKKRSDALKEGDGLRSRDLGAAAATLVLVGWLAMSGAAAVAACAALLRSGLTLTRTDRFEPGRASLDLIATGIAPFATLWGALTIAAIAAGIVLGGGGWSAKALAPRWSRLDPIKGLGRLIGADALIGLVQSILKVAALVVAAGWALWTWRSEIVALVAMPAPANLTAGGGVLTRALWLFAALTAIAAVADVFLQWRRREARLRMSKQEVRDEHKTSEGNPERKRAQRERQYAIAARSARKAMGEATVVLTNPSHFAVALRYRPGIDGVPLVVARGSDEAARAIRDMATEHGVPQIESAMLARAIYFTAQVGQPVAHDLYLAVATVLAFVFDLDAAVARGRRVPEVEVPVTMRFDAEGKPIA